MIDYRYWKPLAAISFWGASFVMTKICLNVLSPVGLITLRFLLGVLFLLGLKWKLGFSLITSTRERRHLIMLALVSVLHLWIQVTGLKYTSAANTGWIMGFTPVLMAVLGLWIFKERLHRSQVIGIILAFVGLILLISRGDLSRISLINNRGDFLVLGSTLTWAVYSAINKQLSLSLSPLTTIFWLFHLMTLILIPFSLNEIIHLPYSRFSGTIWFSLLFLGILCSGWAYVLWAQALQSMPSAHVGMFLYLEPFVTVLISWLVLDETITGLTMISGMIITIGVMMVNLNRFFPRFRLLPRSQSGTRSFTDSNP